MITDDAFVGLSGDTDYSSSSENSDSDSEDGVNNSLTLFGSNKTNYDLIGGVFAGTIVVIVIVAIALWIVVTKMNKKGRPSSSGSFDRNKDSNGSSPRRSDMDVKLGGGTRRRVGVCDRLDIRAGGGYSSRMSSGRTNNENNGFRGPHINATRNKR